MAERNPWRTVALASVVIAGAAVVIALVAVLVNLQRVSQITSDRTTARHVACTSYNNDLVKPLNGLNDQDQSLVRDTFGGVAKSNPAAKPTIDAFVAARVAKYQAVKVKLRDCSPAGIAAYYKRGAK